MLSTIGRAAVRRVGGGASSTTNRTIYNLWNLQRAGSAKSSDSTTQSLSWARNARFYASEAVKAPKPKAATVKKTTASKAKPKSSTTTKKAAPKKKTAVAKKKVPKKKKKAVKKELTPEEKLKANIAALRIKALLKEEPSSGVRSAWSFYVARETKGQKGGILDSIAQLGTAFKSLSPAELEELNHEANALKEAGAVAHKKWVESHTPQEIADANNARKLLRRRLDAPKKFQLLRDDRIPKRPISALFAFTKAKYASGDLKGVGDFKTTSALIQEDWKALSEAERQVYEDQAKADKNRYIQEYKTVFHRDSSASPA